MGIFDIVKCGNEFINIGDIALGNYIAYSMEDDNVIREFLESRGLTLHPSDKLSYNPLLMKQDIFLVGGDKQYRIPYLLLKHIKELDYIESCLNMLKSERLKQIYKYIVQYLFTKDFYFINKLIKGLENNEDFDRTVFPVLVKAITVDRLDRRGLEEAAEVLNGREIISTMVYSRYQERNAVYESSGLEIYELIKSSKKKKNIILVHLESLSNEIYYNQLHNLPNLQALEAKSLRLNNYYSSASSSCMSLIDLFFGNDFESDSFPVFDEMYLNECNCKNMYGVLYENGFTVRGVGYKELKTEEINHFNLWNFGNQKYEWKNTFPEFLESIDGFITENTHAPFALHIWNLMPHIGHNDDDTYKGQSYIERMDLSYISLDMTVGHIWECLARHNLLNDTVIICYGDHGDDKWTRSMNYGCSHIIPPHLNVIKCPAFIYDSRIRPQILNDIVSSVDIKNTSLFLAGIENKEEFPYQGVNIFKFKNTFAYSRSHLANQRLDQRINSEWVARLNGFNDNEHKNKSFGIIGQSYNMVVGNDGLEYFMHRNDPGNYNNLLTFFEIDRNGIITSFNNHSAWRGHFRSIMMADDQIYDIIRNYYILREALIERIKLKNSLIKSDEYNPFDMSLFNKTRERGFIW